MRRANLVILMVLGGQLGAIVLDAQPWPFNNYQMFAHPVKSWDVYWSRGDVAAHLALFPVGIEAGESERERVLEPAHLAPQYPVSLMMAFNKMLGNRLPGSIFPGAPARPGADDLKTRAAQKQAVVRKALLDLQERFNRTRRAEDPPLVGMRLYLMKRDFSKLETLSLSDALERGSSGAHRELIFEVRSVP